MTTIATALRTHTATIEAGDTITVTAQVFDALRHAGLLQRWGWSDGTDLNGERWPIWGKENEDESITCMLRTDISAARR